MFLKVSAARSGEEQGAAQSDAPPRRLTSLDGMRGIAALIVLFSHLAHTNPALSAPHPPFASLEFWATPLAVLKYTPLRFFIAGRAMVLIFFVLSGFVLCLSLKPGAHYMPYILKRLCRIYPPFAFAVLLACTLYLVVDPKPVTTASWWFNQLNWDTPPTAPFVLSNLAMLGVPEWPTINSPTWSLIHELRISIVFPLIVLLLRWRFAASLAASVVIGFISLYFVSSNPAVLTVQLTIGYTTFFFFGAALALKADRLIALAKALPAALVVFLWAFTGVLLIAPMNNPIDSFLPGVGATLLIPLALASTRASRFLESPVPQWLGRVSFSLYLIHMPILLTLVHLLADRVPLGVLCFSTLLISLAAAEICYRLIEQPSIAAGRSLARWWQTARADLPVPVGTGL